MARKIDDPELHAVSEIIKVLSSLDEAARNRVLQWAKSRFVSPTSLSASSLAINPIVDVSAALEKKP